MFWQSNEGGYSGSGRGQDGAKDKFILPDPVRFVKRGCRGVGWRGAGMITSNIIEKIIPNEKSLKLSAPLREGGGSEL
jgi:hypothetical protein